MFSLSAKRCEIGSDRTDKDAENADYRSYDVRGDIMKRIGRRKHFVVLLSRENVDKRKRGGGGDNEVREMAMIAYRKRNVFLRMYPGAWVGRKHRKKHTWTGHRIRKRERI